MKQQWFRELLGAGVIAVSGLDLAWVSCELQKILYNPAERWCLFRHRPRHRKDVFLFTKKAQQHAEAEDRHVVG